MTVSLERALAAKTEALAPDLDRPVFIGGSGRSGTGAVFHWLCAQPGYFPLVRGEAKFIIECDGLIDLHRALTADYNGTRALTAYRRFKDLMLNRLLHADGWSNAGVGARMDLDLYAEAVRSFCDSVLARTTPALHDPGIFIAKARTLLDRLALLSCDAPGARMTEKTPHNLLHRRFLRALYPRARFVHVVRDPRDVVRSIVHQPWGPATIPDACAWLAEYAAAFEREREAAALGPEGDIEVRIEDLTAGDRAAVERLAAFLEIDAATGRGPGDPGATPYAWRAHAEPDEIAVIEERLGGLIARYGYA